MLLALVRAAELPSLSSLGERWGYLTLGISTLLTEELAPLLGGLAAERGHVRLVWVVLVCALAAFVLSMALYLLGRWRAAWVRLRLRRASPIVRRMLNAMRWNPWRATFLARFVFGARVGLLLACGAVRVPLSIFVPGTLAACLAWAAILTALGWGFGEGAVLVLGEARKYERWLGAALVVAVGASWWWIRQRQRLEAEAALGAGS